MSERKPEIIAFVCNWCSYAGADKAGGLKLTYPAEVKLVRVMCSGRVDPQFVLAAFREGADGVLILGCHEGDCHYRSGNIKALRRYLLLKKTLEPLGIDARRLRLDWVAAGEGEKFQKVVEEMATTVTALGPLRLKGHVGSEVA
jgi:F420-non-reducing hydrogenase iron-sulfur subunit